MSKRASRAARRAALTLVAATANTGCPANCTMSVGEDRIVVLDRADVVHAGNVGGDDDVDHARRGAHVGKVERPQAAVRHRTDAQRDVQRAARFGQVVRVVRRARHVQRRRIVRQCRRRRRSSADATAGSIGIERRVRGVHRLHSVTAADQRDSSTRGSRRAHAGRSPAGSGASGCPARGAGMRPTRACRRSARTRPQALFAAASAVASSQGPAREQRLGARGALGNGRDAAAAHARGCDAPVDERQARSTRRPPRCPGRSAC